MEKFGDLAPKTIEEMVNSVDISQFEAWAAKAEDLVVNDTAKKYLSCRPDLRKLLADVADYKDVPSDGILEDLRGTAIRLAQKMDEAGDGIGTRMLEKASGSN